MGNPGTMDNIFDINNIFFDDFKVSLILDDNGEPWFNAKDICVILEYKDIENAIIRKVDNEDKKTLGDLISSRIVGTPLINIEKDSIFTNQLGIYSLVLNSKKNILYVKKYRNYKLQQSLNSKLQKLNDFKKISKSVLIINDILNELTDINDVEKQSFDIKKQITKLLDDYIQTNKYILSRRLI